jgi:hypothetical protein
MVWGLWTVRGGDSTTGQFRLNATTGSIRAIAPIFRPASGFPRARHRHPSHHLVSFVFACDSASVLRTRSPPATDAPRTTNARAPSLVPDPPVPSHRSPNISSDLHHAHVRWNQVCAAQAGASVCLTYARGRLCLPIGRMMRLAWANGHPTAVTVHAARRRY